MDSPVPVIALIPPTRPFRGLRGMDAWGAGGFGAPRKRACQHCSSLDAPRPNCPRCKGTGEETYSHDGQDFVAAPNDEVVALFTGRVQHVGVAKAGTEFGSIHLANDEFHAVILYTRADATVPSVVKVGDRLGTVQDIAGYYRAKNPHAGPMTNHVHLRLRRYNPDGLWLVVNPLPYVALTALA